MRVFVLAHVVADPYSDPRCYLFCVPLVLKQAHPQMCILHRRLSPSDAFGQLHHFAGDVEQAQFIRPFLPSSDDFRIAFFLVKLRDVLDRSPARNVPFFAMAKHAIEETRSAKQADMATMERRDGRPIAMSSLGSRTCAACFHPAEFGNRSSINVVRQAAIGQGRSRRSEAQQRVRRFLLRVQAVSHIRRERQAPASVVSSLRGLRP